jgi:predicted ATPase with chaperone activity
VEIDWANQVNVFANAWGLPAIFKQQDSRIPNHGASIDIVYNADMRVGEIRQFCKLPDEGQNLMRAAMTQLNLSARAYHRILKLARTIADLAGSEEIGSVHLAEALQYRPKLILN